jgi:hypothetical protein
MTSAARKKKPMPEAEPAFEALRRAPVGPPLTEEQRRAVEAARKLDEWVPGPQVTAEIAARRKRSA